MKFFRQLPAWVEKQGKRLLFGCIGLIAACLFLLATTDIHARYVNEPLSYTVGEEHKNALYYPGQPDADTAYLIAGNPHNTIHKTLLSGLLAEGSPVLVTFHTDAAGTENRLADISVLEQEAALLSEKTGLLENQIILIGYHSGGGSLLDEAVLGTKSYRGFVILSPEVSRDNIDEGKIVNGNYQNEKEWINSLTPDMIRQPTLLLSSNTDTITTPYDVTLLYNKFSNDEIIHLGGIYRAAKGNIHLSIVDGGYHPSTPANREILNEIYSFLNQLTGTNLKTGFLPVFRNFLQILLILGLVAGMFFVNYFTRYRFSEVSQGLVLKKEVPSKKFLAIKLVAWIGVIPLAALLVWLYSTVFGSPASTIILYSCILVSFAVINILLGKLLKVPFFNSFTPLHLEPFRFGVGIGYSFLTAGILLFLPYSGIAYRYPSLNDSIQMVGLTALVYIWFYSYLNNEEIFQNYHPSFSRKVAFELIYFFPLVALAILCAIFGGGLSLLMGIIAVALLIGACIMGKGVYYVCGDMVITSLCMALWFQALSMIFVTH